MSSPAPGDRPTHGADSAPDRACPAPRLGTHEVHLPTVPEAFAASMLRTVVVALFLLTFVLQRHS